MLYKVYNMWMTVILSLLFVASISAESCLHPSTSEGRPIPFTDHTSQTLPNGTQAIVTSYQFQCHGQVRAWYTYLHTSLDPSPEIRRTIRFQVWRPAPTVEQDGCYMLIGENILQDYVVGGDNLVSLIASESDAISVESGDVVGLYVQVGWSDRQSADVSNDGEILLDGSYMHESVWYHINTPQDPLVYSGPMTCPFPVGRSLTAFTSAAPILSIDMSLPTTVAPPAALSSTSSAAILAPTQAPHAVTPNTALPIPSKTQGTIHQSLLPTPSNRGVLPSPPRRPPNTTMIGIVVGVVLLAALLLFLLALVPFARRARRKHQQRAAYKDHIYEVIRPKVSTATVDIKVTPNECYAALGPSPLRSTADGEAGPLTPTYGSTVRRGIVESFRNLTIDLALNLGNTQSQNN